MENKIPGITDLATKVPHNTKPTEIKNKIPDSSNFFDIYKFNRLIKIKFYARIVEASKNLATKNQVKTTLDLVDKMREKQKTSNIYLTFY